MTLGMAWTRVVGDCRELLIASDSRLSGGQNWDANPKIMLLPRTDAVLSFAGDTFDAYPLMIQAYNTILMHPPARDRGMDLAELKGHLIRVFNHSRSFISALPHGQDSPDAPETVFALSGYSWKEKSFRVWTLHYDHSIGQFTFRPTKEWRGQSEEAHKMIAYIGDQDVVEDAKNRLISLLRERDKLKTGNLDMEPFEILRDIIRSESFHSVGGSIQIVKIYEHSNAVPVAVYWPDKKSGKVSVLGRPLMDYETIQWGIMDPDSPGKAEKYVKPSKPVL